MTMISVLIKEDDVFYRQCLEAYVQDVIRTSLQERVRFTYSLTTRSVARADLIVVSAGPGEMYACLRALKEGKAGRVIGLFHKKAHAARSLLTQCARDIRLISRQAPLADFRELILQTLLSTPAPKDDACGHCPALCREVLSEQQARIMTGLFNGRSVRELAGDMNICISTVYAHKYVLMNKFHLRSSHDLVRFWTAMTSSGKYL